MPQSKWGGILDNEENLTCSTTYVALHSWSSTPDFFPYDLSDNTDNVSSIS